MVVFLDKYGWPVGRIKGKKVINFIRLLLHTRKIKKGYWDGYKIVTKKEKSETAETDAAVTTPLNGEDCPDIQQRS